MSYSLRYSGNNKTRAPLALDTHEYFSEVPKVVFNLETEFV